MVRSYRPDETRRFETLLTVSLVVLFTLATCLFASLWLG